MSAKILCLFLLLAPVLSLRPPPNYLLRRTSTQQKLHRPATDRDAGEPLILTEYLEAGKIEEAQNLSKVQGSAFPEDIPSYSGFFTIDKSKGSNTYFWFFPAEHDYANAPVLLWLQGGPGSTSLYGLFGELGPFVLSQDSTHLIKHPYSWHKNHSLLFIDNPVGSGFSFSTTNSFPTNEVQIGKDLYEAMVQFFTMFPNLQKNDFFISGESYAGKYIPALGHTIHQNNPNASLKINLKGLIIGDGLTDPMNQLDYSDLVYQWGLVDSNARKEMKELEDKTRKYIADGLYLNATTEWNNIIYLYEQKSNLNYFNIMPQDNVEYDGDYNPFLELNSTRAALHVGSVDFDDMNAFVYNALLDDMMQSVASWVEELLDAGYRVVFYNGQLDVIVAYPLTVNLCRNLKFKDAEAYKNAERKTWGNGTNIFGYTKTAGGLTEILVRNAGHTVPGDQPAVAFDLIYRATRDKF